MSGLNQWRGIVNVGSDPELRFTQGGQPVLDFRGACNEKYPSNGQEKEIVTWVGLVVWGKRGEALSKRLVKGDRLLVEGPLRLSKYEAREGGKRLKVEVVVERLEFMGGRGDAGGAGEEGEAMSYLMGLPMVEVGFCIGSECTRLHGVRLATYRCTGPCSFYVVCDECYSERLTDDERAHMVEVRGVERVRALGLHQLHSGRFPDERIVDARRSVDAEYPTADRGAAISANVTAGARLVETEERLRVAETELKAKPVEQGRLDRVAAAKAEVERATLELTEAALALDRIAHRGEVDRR